MRLQAAHQLLKKIKFLITMLYCVRVGARLMCNNFSGSVLLSCEVERHFPSSSPLSEVRRKLSEHHWEAN